MENSQEGEKEKDAAAAAAAAAAGGVLRDEEAVAAAAAAVPAAAALSLEVVAPSPQAGVGVICSPIPLLFDLADSLHSTPSIPSHSPFSRQSFRPLSLTLPLQQCFFFFSQRDSSHSPLSFALPLGSDLDRLFFFSFL